MSEGGSSQSALGAFLPRPHTLGQNDHLFLGHTTCQVTVYIGRDPRSQEDEFCLKIHELPHCPFLRCIPAALTQGRSVWSTGTIPSHLPTKESSSFHSPLHTLHPYRWSNNNIFIKQSPEKPKSEQQISQLYFLKVQSSPRGKNSWDKLIS